MWCPARLEVTAPGYTTYHGEVNRLAFLYAFSYGGGVYVKCDVCGVENPWCFDSEAEANADAIIFGWQVDDEGHICEMCLQRGEDE